MTVVCMNLSMKKRLFGRRVVGNIDVDGHLVDSLVLLDSEGFGSSFITSEVAWFVHIKPYPRELNLII